MKTTIKFQIISFIILAITWSGSLYAQSTITGVVKIGVNGGPYPPVTITIQGTEVSAETSSEGEYNIGYSSGATITLVATVDGYSDLQKTFTLEPGTNWMNFWFNPPDWPHDFDNNYYQTVVIGDQTWMVENLNTTHYSKGDAISDGTGAGDIGAENNPEYWFAYNDNLNNVTTYGRLYTWHTVSDSRNVCPDGWYVASDDDWKTLEMFLGMSQGDADATTGRGTDEGGKLKEEGTSHWIDPNVATNESGFTALPGGLRVHNGNFLYLGSQAYFWTSTLSGTSDAYNRELHNDDALVYRHDNTHSIGFSVRCIKDTGPLIVSNTNDDGPGSLRYAINYANGNDNPTETDLISFNITGVGPHTIQPLTALPTISEPVIIDGYTQLGAQPATISDPAILKIELYGSNDLYENDHNSSGLTIHGGNNTIRGLMINHFGDDGIHIQGPGGNIIEGNYIGVDASGNCKGNYDGALRIWDSPDNIIGGDSPAQRNVMGSERSHLIQILLSGSVNNVVKGNYLGVGPDGETKLVTGGLGAQVGVRINEGANNNTIGPNNIISGNEGAGVLIAGGHPNNPDPYSNFVIGNNIGTDKDGKLAIGNGTGIQIISSYENTVGIGNIISGNTNYGVEILSENSTGNLILGNKIGLNATGDDAIPNLEGIRIVGASSNQIGGLNPDEGNTISGNLAFGIKIFPEYSSGVPEILSEENVIQRNFIGTDITGTYLISNRDDGVHLENAGNNIISNNVLCGAGVGFVGNNGIEILGEYSRYNVITGNFIGTNASSTSGLGNAFQGIQLHSNAHHNTIGPDNIISGNSNAGILIESTEATDNVIIGNKIGTNVDGNMPLPNIGHGIQIYGAPNNTIGGIETGQGNLISGNGYDGIEIGTGTATGNEILGNLIGTDVAGYSGLLNGGADVRINDAPGNIIGGTEPGARNIIVHIDITNSGAINNHILGNYLGVNADGDAPVNTPASGASISIIDAPNNTIGPLNVISGNHTGISIAHSEGMSSDDATGNWIKGNKIGTDALGLNPIHSSEFGITVHNVQGTIIGGLQVEDRNIISGNGYGIVISGVDGDENVIQGNYLGTDVSGSYAIDNDYAIWLSEGNDNLIGGDTPEARNVISGNEYNGISIMGDDDYQTSGNKIQGNYIGLQANGLDPLGNQQFGIKINNASGNLIGGPEDGHRNIISANGSIDPPRHGIHIEFVDSDIGNTVQGNYVGTDYTGMTGVGNNYYGIMVYHASNTKILDNLVSDNYVGIGIYEEPNETPPFDKVSELNLVKGNLIGLKVNGTESLGNGRHGIFVNRAQNNTVGGTTSSERNIISGNGVDDPQSHGIVISGYGTSGNKVSGNYIGLNAEGTEALGNRGDGIQIVNEASGNIIGGTTWPERNVISGNGVTGMAIYNNAFENTIIGNYIGLDATGTKYIGHPGGTGIYFGGGAHDNLVGGSSLDSANFFAGNTGWAGVALEGLGTDNNLILGNFIGVNINGDEGFGNRAGIQIYDGATDNQIGGLENGQGNMIAYNDAEGVVIYNRPGNEDPTTGNLILSNAIHSNGNLGVDLGALFNESGYYTSGDGVTENDDGDTDESPNNLQNYPVLDSISFSPGTVTVEGYLNSTPNTSGFVLQFFASKLGDNNVYNEAIYGEGQTYLGSETVNTNANGDAHFASTFPIQGISGQVITATATDPNGNTSEFSEAIGGVISHTLAAMNQPFHFSVNENGVPNISSGDDIDAVESAFQAWSDIPTANIQFISDGTTSAQNASASDGMNLVTFRDELFPFAPGVLAIAAKTLKIEPGSEVAQIVDADIVFNPFFVNDEEYNLGIADGGPTDIGFFDIQSVTTHEIGHVLGLIHTGVPTATMFFMMNAGTEYRTLEKDDIAWASYRYPGAGYGSAYGFISGNVTYGDIGETSDPPQPDDHPPVAGTLVLAIDTETNDKIHAYTDANGDYLVPVPVGATGSEEYWIYIEPLDGDVLDGYNLRPGNISSYIYSNTIYTDYPSEFLSDDEGAIEVTPENGTEILVFAGQTSSGNNLITNKDAVSPWIISVNTPTLPETMGVTDPIIVTFSEAIDLNSITNDNFYLSYEPQVGNIIDVYGSAQYFGEMTEMILFSPNEALNYEEEFTLHIETDIEEEGITVVTGVTDLKGNVLTYSWTSTFTTIAGDTDPPVISDVIPDDGAEDIFISSEIMVFFSEPMNRVQTEQGVTVSNTSNPDVEGAFTWNPENTLLTFTPLQSLLEGEEYTITLSTDVADLAGNNLFELADCTFTTVSEANPIITYLAPVDPEVGTINATVETPVVVDFSEPINPATISYSTFNLKSGNSLVTGTYEFLQNNSRVVFRPDADLNFGTTYTITLTTDIYDVSATPLPLEFIPPATFTTAAVPGSPHITYLDPPSGVAGSVVTIAGSGFDPDPDRNTVLFNGTIAPVTNSSLTTLAVNVPMGATSGPVTVSVGSELSNEMFFYIIPQTLDPCEDIGANLNSGSRSRDVAVLPEAGLAYVTNPGSNNVSVIPLNFGQTSDISVGNTPLKIDINPQGTLAYVTNFTSHTVSVIDLALNLVIETIHVGVNPYGVVVSPDGKVYVSNYTSQNVSVIDVDPTSGGFNHVIANINTGTRNRDIDVTPEAALAVIAGDNGLNIVDLDPASINFNTIIANVNSGTRTRDVAVHPEAGLAFVTTEEGNLLVVDIYPTSGSFGTVIANLNSTTARDVRVSPEAMFVYVTNDNGTVSVYQLVYDGVGEPTGGVIEPGATYFWNISLEPHATINIPGTYTDVTELEGLIIDPDAEKLYVVSPGTKDDLGEIIPDTGKLIEISICCGPISPLKSIGDLIIAIQNMINNGIINEGNGNALVAKLDQALTKLSKGQPKPAINVLYAFINQIIDFQYEEEIPDKQAQALIDATYAIIEELEKLPVKSYALDIDDLPADETPIGFIGEIYPNPFNASTTIHYKIDDDQGEDIKVMVRVFNSAGQLIQTLVNQTMAPGEYITEWKGKLEDGSRAPDAVYVIELRAGDQKFVRKVILQRR